MPLRARYYDPVLGRFLQPDPLVPEPGKPQALNRYSYVFNNPLRYRDPSGHCPMCWALWETLFGHGVSAAGGDEFDPTTGQSCGDGGCVTARPSQAQMALGVAQDVAVGETTARGVSKVAEVVVGRIAGQVVEPGTSAMRELATETTELAGKQVTQEVTGEIVEQVAKDVGRVDPAKVRFSQSSINYRFKDPAMGTIDDLAAGLRSGKINPSDIPPIRVVERNSQLFTLDNRRLEAFKRAGIDIPYRYATPEEVAKEGWKFTTTNEGITILVRGEP